MGVMRGPWLRLVSAAAWVAGWGCGGSSSGGADAGDDPCEPMTGGDLLAGIVSDATTGAPVAGARVTVDLDVAFLGVAEARTDAAGRYRLGVMSSGPLRVGASAPGLEYREVDFMSAGGCTRVDIALGPEVEQGMWENLGDPGEAFGGTNSGVLLPDGRLMYCHDTLDPVVLDPVTGSREYPPPSPRLQGCHAVTLRPDGTLIYVGGADVPVYGPGTRQVKTFDPETFVWTMRSDLNDYRWYPSMAPLPDGSLLAVGGGGLDNPVRVATSETMHPATLAWTAAGDIALGNEVSPILLLYTGDVLMTHRPPQLYDPGTRMWRLAGDFVQGPRMPNGDHADHELFLLGDGRVVAIGCKGLDPPVCTTNVEIYDPAADAWSLGQNQLPLRSRASSVMLPAGRILVLGGAKEDDADPTPVNEYGYMAIADLYDPASDSWRRLADMSLAREYHAMPIVVPDGRVFIAGGEGMPGNEPPASTVEAFSPPYLFRGPRPGVSGLSATTLARGETLTFAVVNTRTPTRVVLMGTSATTHFMDSGNARYLELPFTFVEDGLALTMSATLPMEPERAVFGYYLLFVLVDDIPSNGIVVRITS